MRGNSQDVLQGMLSKKNFLNFLKSGKIGHMRDYPNSTPYYAPRLTLKLWQFSPETASDTTLGTPSSALRCRKIRWLGDLLEKALRRSSISHLWAFLRV